jgi:hypothetical protein
MNLRFYKQRNKQRRMYFDFQTSSSLQNQESLNFLTCDGVIKKMDFKVYLEPFDALTWLGTITSLLIYSNAIAGFISRSPNTSFVDSCLSSLFMKLSFLTGVANVPHKFIRKSHLSTIRILFWGIATIVLCSAYSSLVTTNVIAPKTFVSPWTEYKQLDKFSKVFGMNNQEMLFMEENPKLNKSDPLSRFISALGSKVSRLLVIEMFENSENKSQFISNFVDSYSYVVRSDVKKLKELLSVCTNTALIDTETSIDSFLQIWNQDENLPSMVKGSPFFQQSHSWTIIDAWLFRKLLSFRLKTFTTSGIIGFWERFCLKHCKSQSEFQNSAINSKTFIFKAQKLGSNITSLFLMLLIASAISILCFLFERVFSLTC